MTAPAGYALVFCDEFDKPFLDTSKWWTRLTENGGTAQLETSNGDVQLFEEGQDGRPCHILTGSSIKLMVNAPLAPATSHTAGCLRSKYVSAMQKGIYIEFRAKFSNVQGMWPAGWVSGEPRPDGSTIWPPEIDIAECPVNNVTGNVPVHMGLQTNGIAWAAPNFTDWANHPEYLPFRAREDSNAAWNPQWGATLPNGTFDQWSNFLPPFDISADFHTYSLLYEPGGAGQPRNFTIAVDGKMTMQGTYDWIGADSGSVFACLIFDVEVGGRSGGTVDDSKLPCAAMEIEYVHVYEKMSVAGQDFYHQVGQ